MILIYAYKKNETCNYSRDFLLALQSCYLPPNIDKPTRVHKNSASLTDNIFVNNPEQVLISGNLITDVSDHFSQFCILTSTRDKIKRKQIKKRGLSHFNSDSVSSDLARIDDMLQTSLTVGQSQCIFCYISKFK